MKILHYISATLLGVLCLMASCKEESILTNANDVSYLRFTKNMTKDTTVVSFKVYNEGEDAVIPIEVSINGKVQTEDLPFSISVDESRTTLDANLYVLPTDCKIRKGHLTDIIYITLKNSPELKTQTKRLALMVDETEQVRQGDRNYARAIINVTDRLFKPDWWSVNDLGSETQPENSVDWYYLGEYSEKKYQLFLMICQEDNFVYDGKDKQMLRKYSLKLKNWLKDQNEGKPEDEWIKDENDRVIEIPVAG